MTKVIQLTKTVKNGSLPYFTNVGDASKLEGGGQNLAKLSETTERQTKKRLNQIKTVFLVLIVSLLVLELPFKEIHQKM